MTPPAAILGAHRSAVRMAGAVALALMLASSTPAGAQTGGQDAEAKALFQAGRVAFGEGRFDSALKYFQQAYNLSPRPALLYNIGSAADRLRRDGEALAAFEEYLAKVPDADNRAEVEARIAVLRQATAPPPPAPAPAVVPAPWAPETTPGPPATPAEAPHAPEATPATTGPATDAASSERGAELAPWIVIGVSGAVLITGGVMLALALGDVSTVEDASEGTRWAEISDAHDRAPTLSGIGIGLAAAGAAGLAVGAMWLGMDTGEPGELQVGVSPSGVLVGGTL